MLGIQYLICQLIKERQQLDEKTVDVSISGPTLPAIGSLYLATSRKTLGYRRPVSDIIREHPGFSIDPGLRK